MSKIKAVSVAVSTSGTSLYVVDSEGRLLERYQYSFDGATAWKEIPLPTEEELTSRNRERG